MRRLTAPVSEVVVSERASRDPPAEPPEPRRPPWPRPSSETAVARGTATRVDCADARDGEEDRRSARVPEKGGTAGRDERDAHSRELAALAPPTSGRAPRLLPLRRAPWGEAVGDRDDEGDGVADRRARVPGEGDTDGEGERDLRSRERFAFKLADRVSRREAPGGPRSGEPGAPSWPGAAPAGATGWSPAAVAEEGREVEGERDARVRGEEAGEGSSSPSEAAPTAAPPSWDVGGSMV